MVPLDVFLCTHTLNPDGTKNTYHAAINGAINGAWLTLIYLTIIMVFLALPVMIVFYESDVRQKLLTRILLSFKM